MGIIRIGTSGFSYLDWKGTFYPEELPRHDFLQYYAKYFGFTELNFTYYRQPTSHTLLSMLKQTPDTFTFSIKAPKTLTHEIDSDWISEAMTFKNNISPLYESNRLIGILFQFPYSFHYTKQNRIYLAELSNSFSKYPMFIEFRNREWQKPQVFNDMQKRNLHYVIVDLPQIGNLPLSKTTIISSIGYIRFHGRNKENWWKGTNVSRYDYLYSKDELSEWLPALIEMATQNQLLVIAFNNHHKGNAVKNALQIKEMLSQNKQLMLL